MKQDHTDATSADYARGYKWALAGGDPPSGNQGSDRRKMFMRGFSAGLETLNRPKPQTIWEYARAS